MSGVDALVGESRPALSPHARMKKDPARGWVLLGPERVLVLDDIAVEVLKLCDGVASIGVIADDLAQRFAAPRDQVLADVTEMMQNLRDKGLLTA